MKEVENDELEKRVTECAKLIEEKLHEQNVSSSEGHVQLGRTMSAERSSSSDWSKMENSSLKHYVSASDLHGLIHEVQLRVTKSGRNSSF